jgi:hypothetical protein
MASLNHTKIHIVTREVTASMQPCRIDNTLTTIMHSSRIPLVALGCKDEGRRRNSGHVTFGKTLFTSRPDRFSPRQCVLGYCI